MKFGVQINKKDLITIVILAVVFFSIAATNLGETQIPQTSALLTAGQSFYVNLGSQTNVQSIVILIDLGGYNFTVSTGSPGNWTTVNNNVYPSSSSSAEPYYSWESITVAKT